MGKTIRVKAERMTKEELEKAKLYYADAYINSPSDGDPHGKFAELMGVDRDRAKSISYEFTWTHRCWLFNFMEKERFEKSHLVHQLLKYRRAAGETVSVYQILDEAEIAAEVKVLKRKQAKRKNGRTK